LRNYKVVRINVYRYYRPVHQRSQNQSTRSPMYIPRHYRQEDQAVLLRFMQQYSFATLVTARDTVPTATHIPVIAEQGGDELFLYSHIARANKQWEQFAGTKSLIIFQEPHAYISPGHYEKELNVPTWNYVAVHAYGLIEIIAESDEVIRILEKMIQFYEPAYAAQWSRLPADYKERMAKGIVCFRMRVSELQGKEKLSQNKTATEIRNIIGELSHSSSATERELAGIMADRFGK
jgi:transcriptional regulator